MLASRLVRVLLWSSVLCAATTARAESVLESLDRAKALYQAGDRAGTRQVLTPIAKTLEAEEKDQLAAMLPTPLPGWKGEYKTLAGMGSPDIPFYASQHYVDESRKFKSGDLTLPTDVILTVEYNPGAVKRHREEAADPAKAKAKNKQFISTGDPLVFKKLCPSTWCADTGDLEVVRIIDEKFIVYVLENPRPGNVDEMVAYARRVQPPAKR